MSRPKKIMGERRLETEGFHMTWHLVGNEANHMYRCACLPGFRSAGGHIHYGAASAKQRGFHNHKYDKRDYRPTKRAWRILG